MYILLNSKELLWIKQCCQKNFFQDGHHILFPKLHRMIKPYLSMLHHNCKHMNGCLYQWMYSMHGHDLLPDHSNFPRIQNHSQFLYNFGFEWTKLLYGRKQYHHYKLMTVTSVILQLLESWPHSVIITKYKLQFKYLESNC